VRAFGAVALVLALALGACGSSSSTSSTRTTAQGPAPAAAGPCRATSATPPETVAGAPLDTILRVPASVRGRRAPLLVALHFASGTGAEMEQATRYTPQARRSGFVVAYPTASAGNFWQSGDVDKLAATIDAIQRTACIDPRRVYLSGISNGGTLANEAACRMADRVAAVALFAPGMGGEDDCRPSRPMPLLEIHGTADPIVPYGAVPAFLAGWARRDGCSAAPRSQALGGPVTRATWPGCDGGAVVEHLRLDGGHHIELLPELREAGVDPAATAWRFLAGHRLPT
jgi:polyhydroxybutyrate depolymerase